MEFETGGTQDAERPPRQPRLDHGAEQKPPGCCQAEPLGHVPITTDGDRAMQMLEGECASPSAFDELSAK